jgi:hypothetical protein
MRARKKVESLERLFKQTKNFHDFMVLSKISKEFVKREARRLYDVFLFSIMGLLGSSSSLILLPDQNDLSRWIIAFFADIVMNYELRFDPREHTRRVVKRGCSSTLRTKRTARSTKTSFRFVSIDALLLCPSRSMERLYGAVSLARRSP